VPPDPLEGLCFTEKIPLIYDQPKFQMTNNQMYFWLAILSEQNFIIILIVLCVPVIHGKIFLCVSQLSGADSVEKLL